MYTKTVPVTKEVNVYDVSDYSECGKVAYESWGAHYTNGQEQGKKLIKLLTECEKWELYRISTTGDKTGIRKVTVEKALIKQPWDPCADEEDALILTDEGGNKLLIDVNHIPYQVEPKGFNLRIFFSTGLVMQTESVATGLKALQ